MKNNLLFILLLVWANKGFTQASQIVFEADSGNGGYSFWSVLAVPGAKPLNLTTLIDAKATQSGRNDGPINVSHNGKWYSFVSEQFDADCGGWGCLTVADSNFNTIVSIKDMSGTVFHNERIAMVSDDGKAIVFATDNGPHSRDVFIIHKTNSGWTTPKVLSSGSTLAYNINPRFSFDHSKVVFQASSQEFPGEVIYIIDTNGNNLTNKINISAIVNGINGCSEVHMPAFAPDGSIYFEGHWSGERLWHYANAASTPVLVDGTDGNDNSPVILPDGRIASLQLPNATHDLKIENANGTGKFFLTGSSSTFPFEVYDNGMGAGAANPAIATAIEDLHQTNSNTMFLYPNPAITTVTLALDFNQKGTATISICNVLGQEQITKTVAAPEHSQPIQLNIEALNNGWYSVKYLFVAENGNQITQSQRLEIRR